ncbi:hypothetical protein [Saccharophagus degradans]|uniref:hypothetical protein n=1 Tax=Saccharophagus degradans TaxID=86304 RepID=UPI00059DF0AC|nr:hypothetical protein [Saccharophagus degradans]
MEIVINILAYSLIGILVPYLGHKYNKKKYKDIEKRIFRDLGEKIEITTSLGTWPFKAKVRRVKKGSVIKIKQAAVVSLFLSNKGVIDLFHGCLYSKAIAREAAKYFPEAEIEIIPLN